MARWNNKTNPPFLMGLNAFSDYTPAELTRMLMKRTDPSRARTRGGGVFVGGKPAAAAAAAARARQEPPPPDWNWATRGIVSEVRDQLGCGSCWAFAALAVLESRALIDGTDRGPNYSEQQMVDCVTEAAGLNFSSAGCSGGLAEDVFRYVSTSFAAQEDRYRPYVAQNGTGCRAAGAVGAVTLSSTPGFELVPGNPEAIMQAIYESPVVAYMFAPSSLFSYTGGTIPASYCAKENPKNIINHAVVLVGYSRAEKYWIARNSWGATWGMGGYARLEMTDGGNGACAMYKNSMLAIPRGTTAKYVRAQPPPTVPPPSRPPSPPPTPPAPSVASLPPAAWWAVASDGSGKVLAAINQGDDALFSDPGDIFISRDAAGSWSNCSGAGRRPWNSIAIAANGGLLLASHDGPGSLYTSSDGSTWTAVATQHGALAWVATAASSDGQRLAAAVDSGAVYTSPDRGVSWVPQAAAGARAWTALASSGDGRRLAAAVSQGYLYTSNDYGATWVERRPLDEPQYWSSVALSRDGLRLLASSGPCLHFSGDGGATWSKTRCSALGSWTRVAVSADGTRLFAASQDTDAPGVFVSSDGQAWLPCGATREPNIYSIASSANGQRLVASSLGAVFVSADGCGSWDDA